MESVFTFLAFEAFWFCLIFPFFIIAHTFLESEYKPFMLDNILGWAVGGAVMVGSMKAMGQNPSILCEF